MYRKHSLTFVFITVCAAQFTSREFCVYIGKYNCLSQEKSPQCGTDGNDYYNDCEFAQAHCKNINLHRASLGRCPVGGANGTTSNPPVNGAEVALDIFCLDLFHHACNESRPVRVCGSDNVTYTNLCEFDKKRCTHRELHILHVSPCV